MTAPFVSVRGLSVGYTTQVVHDVSFDILRGESLALVGESGSGKTTIARAVLRLTRVNAGAVLLDGVDVLALHGSELQRMRRRMQIVFQDPQASLNPRMRVGDAIAEGMDVHGIAQGAARAERVAALLLEVGLDADYATRWPRELSGGQRQRVAIARALAVEPEFLVLDEAVSALDVTTQARLLELLAHIRSVRALTCLFIAHNLAVVQHFAEHVAVVYDGRVVEYAPTAALFAAPRHPYTRALLDAVPVPDPQVRRTRPAVTEDAEPAVVSGGCAYFPRCRHPLKSTACQRAVPLLTPLSDAHAVACIHEMRG